ncbi:MAG: putative aldo/keto reductase [Gemmatimonadales bacterium]|nr:putative aldo/keto reductase [Gemmatimonadales bacterium]
MHQSAIVGIHPRSHHPCVRLASSFHVGARMETIFDPCITRVGFGAWAIDGSGWSFAWGSEDDGHSTAAIRHALDYGVDWIDTSAVQNVGGSEEDTAELCDLSPDPRPYVFAKCGLIFEEGRRAGTQRHSRWPASIRQECEASLQRLGVERIDLYHLRWSDMVDARVEESLPASVPAFAAHRIGLVWCSPSQVDFLPQTMSKAGTLASAVAVTWTLASRGVAGAIVSAGSAEQIESWIDAVTLVLSRANLGEIVAAIGRTGARRGPRQPSELAA